MNFVKFSETFFEKFRDRVKNWTTFNEPYTYVIQGYDVGLQAPGRCSIIIHLFCTAENSTTEPYLVGNHVLISHVKAFDIYGNKFKGKQSERIGIGLDVMWYEHASNSLEDIAATQRPQDFQFGC
ncbi:hypothetical protein KI387_002271, partial [Taxus chinensis]